MQYNRFVWAASLAAFAVIAAVLLTTSAAPSSQDDVGSLQDASASSSFKMTSLFDFKSYKRLFKKRYSGIVENMVRFKLFTSRAIRASISAIKYRFRQQKYHLAINHMSDISPEELDMMRNKVLEREYGSSKASSSDDLPDYIPRDDENVVATLGRLIDENAGKPEYEALRAQLEKVDVAPKQQSPGRRKRQVELAEEGPRELPLEKLVNVAPENPDEELPADTRAKIVVRPNSENPQYKGIELPTQGLADQQVHLYEIYLDRWNQAPEEIRVDVFKTLESVSRESRLVNGDVPGDAESAKLPDEVFIDLRKTSNCFLSPRSQGNCGACYAFAAITMAEWIHCHTTGKLVALSEQYLIDCGKVYQPNVMNGCNGGTLVEPFEFFHNFGLELRSAYPYMEREQQCPYDPDTDLRTVGYIRADVRKLVQYHISIWPMALVAIGPLAVSIYPGHDFSEYGSGVYSPSKIQSQNHAMVLIGHGREDGDEYWLIRNSHSVGWGERGYLKLSKKCNCILVTGWSWGSDDGYKLTTKLAKNELNDGEAVKKHYAKNVQKTFLI